MKKLWILRDCDRMLIYNAVEAFCLILERNKILQCPKIISQCKVAAGLNSGKITSITMPPYDI